MSTALELQTNTWYQNQVGVFLYVKELYRGNRLGQLFTATLCNPVNNAGPEDTLVTPAGLHAAGYRPYTLERTA